MGLSYLGFFFSFLGASVCPPVRSGLAIRQDSSSKNGFSSYLKVVE
jgi:hypothetical protein